MMSEEDLDLLERKRPELMMNIDLEGSTLLAHLRMRGVLRAEQQQLIEVRSKLQDSPSV